MAWDFTTEPEFQEKLDWVDEFVSENVEPLMGILSRENVSDSSIPDRTEAIPVLLLISDPRGSPSGSHRPSLGTVA